MACSIDTKKKAINRYANVFKSNGLDKDKANKLAEEQVNILLGSTSEEIDITGINPEVINSTNVGNIFDRLMQYHQSNPTDSDEHIKELKRVLNQSKSALKKVGDQRLYTVYNQGITRGSTEADTISLNINDIQQAPIPMSPVETFVHEIEHVITKAALEDKKNFTVVKEITRLWEETKSHLTKKYGKGNEYEIFLNKDANGNIVYLVNANEEIAAAKARYDYIFGSSSVTRVPIKDIAGNVTSYKTIPTNLHEFVAFGRTNEALIKELSKFKFRNLDKKKPETFQERIEDIYHKILNWFTGALTNTKNVTGKKALENLVLGLTKVQKQNKFTTDSLMKKLDIVNGYIGELVDYTVWQPLEKWSWNKVRKDESNIISLTAGFINPRSHERYKDVFKEVRRNRYVGARSLVYDIVKEATFGSEKWVEKLIYRSKGMIDRAVEKEREVVSKNIKDSIASELSKEESEAVTRSILMLDLSSLNRNIDDINKLLKDEDILNREIGSLVNSISAPTEVKNYYMNQARSLGHFMATGRFMIHNTMPNAHAISLGKGNRSLDIDTHMASTNVDIIDKLASLYGIQYLASGSKKLASDFITREQDKSKNNNMISFLLSLHTEFKKESLQQSFNGNPMQMNKGYMEELFDPNVDIKVVGSAERKELEKEGYKFVKEVKTADDDSYPHKRYMYRNKYAGLSSWNKTAFSLTNETHRGTSITTRGGENLNTNDYIEGLKKVTALKNTYRNAASAISSKPFHPDKGVIYKPVINEFGEIVDYTHVMDLATKKELLNPKMTANDVLAATFARMVNKTNSKVINKEILGLLKEDYNQNFSKNSKDFVTISAKSKDPELKEIYKLLPNWVKNDLQHYFGGREIIIRETLVRDIFGHRDKSITNNKWLNHQAIQIAERIIKEIVSIAKTSIVIRSFRVLRDNIISNTIYLVMSGVPIEKSFQLQMKGVKGIHSYLKDETRIRSLELKLSNKNITGSERSSIKAQIKTLQRSLELNPIYPLVKRGLFQTIVEDLDPDRDDFNLTSKFYDWVKPDNALINTAEKVGKELYIAKDTTSFNLLLKSTQYSDFVARFAMYEHHMGVIKDKPNVTSSEIEREEERLIKLLIDMFINYDTPTNPYIKYMNDYGLALFTRYPLRIMKSLYAMIGKRPSNIALALMMQQILGIDVPDPTDSTILDKNIFSNPIDVMGKATEFHGFENIIGTVS